MKVIDTNILLRFFIDDPDDVEAKRQKPFAEQVMSQPVYISMTVILEFEWVMRGFYKLHRAKVIEVFTVLMSYAHIVIEDKPILVKTLELHREGLDFADALHLVQSLMYQGFVTFDNNFYKRAKKLGYAIELADNSH